MGIDILSNNFLSISQPDEIPYPDYSARENKEKVEKLAQLILQEEMKDRAGAERYIQRICQQYDLPFQFPKFFISYKNGRVSTTWSNNNANGYHGCDWKSKFCRAYPDAIHTHSEKFTIPTYLRDTREWDRDSYLSRAQCQEIDQVLKKQFLSNLGLMSISIDWDPDRTQNKITVVYLGVVDLPYRRAVSISVIETGYAICNNDQLEIHITEAKTAITRYVNFN